MWCKVAYEANGPHILLVGDYGSCEAWTQGYHAVCESGVIQDSGVSSVKGKQTKGSDSVQGDVV